MGIVFKNNAKTTLSSAVNNSTTTIPVTEGSVFPAVNLSGAGTFFLLTLDDESNNEIVKVTSCSGAAGNIDLTVIRAQEGTTARAFSSGNKAELRFTSGTVDEIRSDNSVHTNIFTTANNSTTAFTLSDEVANENDLVVFIDGVFQAHNSFSVSGTTLTLATAPESGRVVTVYSIKGSRSASNVALATMTGDNSDTTLTLPVEPINENSVQVFFDGVYQNKDSFSISGTTLTFGVAPPTGIAVEALIFTKLAINTSSILSDTDADTKVQVEESSDEDKIRFDTGGTERAIIDSTGLGIGTSSPASNLHISATGEARLILEGDSDNDSGEESSLLELRTDGGAVRHRVEATGSSGNDLKITAGADQTTSTLNSEIIFETKTANSSTAERMRIDADGNVGIGVTSIVREPLQVHRASTSDVQIHMTNTSTGTTSSDGMTIFANSSTSGFWYREAGNMLFATSSTERMRISSLGEVAIGSTSIFTSGSDNSGSGTLHIANNNGRVLYLKRAGSNGEIVSFYRGGISGEVGNISISTSTTAYNTSSDYRLKENVNYEFNALDRLKQLKPARFNFIIEKDETVDGFLAHEVSSIVPEAITGEKDAVDKEGNPIYQGIDQSKLVPLLTKAIQELSAKVEELEGKIE